jgi:hypothetical protein
MDAKSELGCTVYTGKFAQKGNMTNNVGGGALEYR